LGFRILDLGFRVNKKGFGDYKIGLRFRVQDLGLMAWGRGFKV
jgi:hypothetical protein